MESLIEIILAIALVYAIVPGIVSRFGLGTYRKSRSRSRRDIAFTFDDGPDPYYTPQLLDLLKQYHIKATFFIVGAKAERYPELILRMHQEGHAIGIHNYIHRSNWLMSPWAVHRGLNRSTAAIERIIGVRPQYYRPPWGLLNLLDLVSLRKKFQIVLWSVMVGDWRSKGGSEKIKNRLRGKIGPGAVVVLHDSGETLGADSDAPAHTIKALEIVLPEIIEQGYNCVRIDELIKSDKQFKWLQRGFLKQLIVFFWLKWELLFQKVFHVQPIDKNNPFFKVRVCTYGGQMLPLSDGEKIQKKDYVVELHFNNETLLQMIKKARTPVQLAVQMIRSAEQLLPQIAEFILKHPDGEKIKGLYGISMIYRGSEQLGFTVLDLPKGIFYFFTKIYLRLLMYVIHPDGKQRLHVKSDFLVPKKIAMSKHELIRKYGNKRLQVGSD